MKQPTKSGLSAPRRERGRGAGYSSSEEKSGKHRSTSISWWGSSSTKKKRKEERKKSFDPDALYRGGFNDDSPAATLGERGKERASSSYLEGSHRGGEKKTISSRYGGLGRVS